MQLRAPKGHFTPRPPIALPQIPVFKSKDNDEEDIFSEIIEF
jgi:hypothetical protein